MSDYIPHPESLIELSAGEEGTFYVVTKGRLPGIYVLWSEAHDNVDGYSGASYKSFKSWAEAKEYYTDSYKIHCVGISPPTPKRIEREQRTQPYTQFTPSPPSTPKTSRRAPEALAARPGTVSVQVESTVTLPPSPPVSRVLFPHASQQKRAEPAGASTSHNVSVSVAVGLSRSSTLSSDDFEWDPLTSEDISGLSH